MAQINCPVAKKMSLIHQRKWSTRHSEKLSWHDYVWHQRLIQMSPVFFGTFKLSAVNAPISESIPLCHLLDIAPSSGASADQLIGEPTSIVRSAKPTESGGAVPSHDPESNPH
jgi:hypothetical protein